MRIHFVRFLGTASALAVLAGCGGGGDDDPAGPIVIDSGTARLLADGSEITSADFVGVSFPLYFADADTGGTGSDSEVKRGKGSITIDSTGNVLTIVIPTEGTFVFNRVGVTDKFVLQGTDFEFELDDLLSTRTFFADDGDLIGINGFVGAYGLETPVDQRPTLPVTYNADALGRMYIAESGTEGFVQLNGINDVVNLTANFDTGSVTGQLFEGSASVEFDDDGLSDDTLRVNLSLQNGTISSTGFSGTVGGNFFVLLDDAITETELDVTLSNTGVDGAFFGNAADRIAATFGGEYSADLGDGDNSAGQFVGFVDAAAD